MRLICVLRAVDIGSEPPDLILLPEGVERTEITAAAEKFPHAIIVGAILEGEYSRAILWHEGRNRVDYLKVECDGRTRGTGNIQQTPVYEAGDVCVAVLICMDVNHGAFSHRIEQRLNASQSKFKIVCIPADMSSHWFPEGEIAPGQFCGAYVMVCNHTETHQQRCKSFIVEPDRTKRVIQVESEPVSVVFPRHDSSR